MKKPHMMLKRIPLATCGLLIAASGSAHAVLAITNGDFQSNAPGSNVADVDSWFDAAENGQTDGAWFLSTWYGPTVSPNGTSVMGLSWSGGSAAPSWAYQLIGVNDGALGTLDLEVDIGSFTDAGGPRDIGVTFSVYQSDGTFVPAENVDIDGAAGITFIGSSDATEVLLPGTTATKSVSVDISSANTTGDLFLRINNFDNGEGDPWAAVDNLSIVPEPSSVALSGLGLVGLLVRRRRQS